MKLFVSQKSKPIADKIVIAIGGGTIIDKAKIYAKKKKKICIAIPTTGAGASETSHAVKWGKTKENIHTNTPISILPPVPIKLDKETRYDTDIDILCHILDVLQKCSDNDRINIGIEAGRWIEKYGTGLTHKASYPIKIKYNLTHGQSLRQVIIQKIVEAYPIWAKH